MEQREINLDSTMPSDTAISWTVCKLFYEEPRCNGSGLTTITFEGLIGLLKLGSRSIVMERDQFC